MVEGGEGGDGLEGVGEHRRVVGAEAERQRPHQRRELKCGPQLMASVNSDDDDDDGDDNNI